jgi:hypothetical protein
MLGAMKVAVWMIALAACRANQPSPPVSNRVAGPAVEAPADAALSGGAAALAKLEQFADDMCKCPDRDCADHVVDAMTQWAEDLARGGDATPKVNSAEDEQARVATDRMSRCMADVYRRRGSSSLIP